MADYIYLLQTRLTPAQSTALERVRDVSRTAGTTVFLVGGAVRDLTAGFAVRDLDFAIQGGDATRLKKAFQQAGFTVTGEHGQTQSLFLSFPGGVRLEVSSTQSATYPKPGKPVFAPATILEDLRRRDFTANAMAISLNEGSFGLLMDPLNGVADLENMELRLVSNYGFIEDPVRMIRAARLAARLGWRLEEKTQGRYETGKEENYINALSAWQRGYETEEIFHEEDPLRVLRRLEAEGWAKFLFPAWTSAKANEPELNKLRDVAGQLQLAGIHADPSAAYFPLLTAKVAPKDVAELKKSFPRPGFVTEIESLEAATKGFAAEFSSKAAATPSAAWKMLYAAPPEQVLSLAYSSKSAPVQARFKAFFTEWPQARHRIPYQAMQEMRITPDLPIYDELMDKLFFALMDAQLETPEAIKAFLEPFSPPAPPPPPNLRRRPVKREAKAPKAKKSAAVKVPVEAPEDVALPAAHAEPETPAAPAPKATPKVAEKAAVDKGVPVAPAKSTSKGASSDKAAAKLEPAKKAAKTQPPSKKAAPAAGKSVASKAVKPAAKKAAARPVTPKKAATKVTAKKPAVKPVAKKTPVKAAVKKQAAVQKPAAKKATPPAKKTASKSVKKAAKRR